MTTSRNSHLITGVTAKLPAGESPLEKGFLRLWKKYAAHLPEPVRQHRFTTRKWRFDFAWPELWIAVEIQGGLFKGLWHQRGRQYHDNCEKYTEAAIAGWSVLLFTTIDMDERPMQTVEKVAEFVRTRVELAK
ncbi:hypothetical protein LCGC14_1204650 [marine sediment metagenome]|uniref:DUF559 domain-containing protein n=1 Tax=marine sediment metagenome TaxID=412755 RepID=A0A0F9NY95_9ZZZZ